jgi:hypothetical protein
MSYDSNNSANNPFLPANERILKEIVVRTLLISNMYPANDKHQYLMIKEDELLFTRSEVDTITHGISMLSRGLLLLCLLLVELYRLYLR